MQKIRKQRILILGNGGAAAHAIMAARRAGFEGEIHLVSDTDNPAFNPMLAPYYLKGALAWKHCFPFGPDFYQKYHVIGHFGSAVKHLDAAEKTALLANGKKISYSKCLLATGASPIIPPIPGLQGSPCTFPLRTADSALKIQDAMQSAQKVIVLGASLVGVRVAEILHKKGVDVILLDVAPQIMPGGAHSWAAKMLQGYIEEQGIDVRIGCSLEGTFTKQSVSAKESSGNTLGKVLSILG